MTDGDIQRLLIEIVRVGIMSCIALGLVWLILGGPEME